MWQLSSREYFSRGQGSVVVVVGAGWRLNVAAQLERVFLEGSLVDRLVDRLVAAVVAAECGSSARESIFPGVSGWLVDDAGWHAGQPAARVVLVIG